VGQKLSASLLIKNNFSSLSVIPITATPGEARLSVVRIEWENERMEMMTKLIP
jgi:hypothetical protein